MRRAILVAAGTVVGLVALLDYKSGGALTASHVAGGGGVPVSAGSTTTAPATTVPAGPPSSSTSAPGGKAPSTSTATGPASYTGADVNYVYGTIEVRITVAGARITAISTPVQSADDPHSAAINAQAIPILTQEAIAAQGVHIDVVSGATFTSNAFAQSLQSAIAKEAK